jgi:hypothetical protein
VSCKITTVTGTLHHPKTIQSGWLPASAQPVCSLWAGHGTGAVHAPSDYAAAGTVGVSLQAADERLAARQAEGSYTPNGGEQCGSVPEGMVAPKTQKPSV